MSIITEAKIYNEYPDFTADSLPEGQKPITLVVKVDDQSGWYTYDGGYEYDRQRLESEAKAIIGKPFDTGIMLHSGATYHFGK